MNRIFLVHPSAFILHPFLEVAEGDLQRRTRGEDDRALDRPSTG
jgi:hypothetical protein